jgi:hypothetical protein
MARTYQTARKSTSGLSLVDSWLLVISKRMLLRRNLKRCSLRLKLRRIRKKCSRNLRLKKTLEKCNRRIQMSSHSCMMVFSWKLMLMVTS